MLTLCHYDPEEDSGNKAEGFKRPCQKNYNLGTAAYLFSVKIGSVLYSSLSSKRGCRQ